MSDRRPCSCGYVTINPDADSSAVCGGCGRPLGEAKPLGGDTQAFVLPPPDADPAEHVVKLRRKAPPTPPPEVPGYEILGELGRGGMGVVYKAREKVLNRVVALKMILAGAHASESERARFRKEAEAVAALHHAGIVQIFHVGEHAGQPYLVLEYVDGGNLADKIAGGNLMPVREAATVVEQLATAMQYAHDQGVIHRDLKPANILLSKGDGRKADSSGSGGSDGSSVTGPRAVQPSSVFKISDFGLAKKLDETVAAGGGTRTGAVMGTPSYISPEQAAGKAAHVTARSDVYSLGAILYEMLTDRPPFKADTPLETVLQVINDDPVWPSKLRPKLPRDVETICLKCLQKDPLKRYGSAGELAADLGRFLRGEAILARPLSPLARGWKWARRHPAVSVFGLTAGAAIAAVVVVLATTNAGLAEAKAQKEQEAKIAREQEAIAKEQTEKANQLASERQAVLDKLASEDERNRRSLFALQLSQVAGIVSRDPTAALRLLDDPVKCPAEYRDFTWRYLRRLCGRAEKVLTAHNRPVRAAAVSPDGLLVATADDGGTVLLWHPQTKAVYARLVGHTRAVTGVAFAPDGRTLATTSADGTLRLWRLEADFLETVRLSSRLLPDAQAELNRWLPTTPGLAIPLKPAAVLPAFARGGRCVAFSPDGTLLAAGGSDRESMGQGNGAAKVWRVADLLPQIDPARATLLGPAAGVGEWAAAHPPGSLRPVKEVRDHLRPVLCITFSPNGLTLATGSEDRGVILSPLQNGDRGQELRLHGGPVHALAYSPDGATLATADNDESPTIVLWDVSKRRATEKGKLVGHTAAVHALAFSPDGRTLASAAGGGVFDSTVRVWDVDTATETARLYGHRGTVHAVGWLPDRRTLVSAGDDATARVWQTSLRTCEAATPFGDEPAKVLAAALTPSGNTVVTADARGGLRLWAVDKLFSGREDTAELPVYLTSGKPADAREWQVNGLAVSADGTLIAVAAPDGVRVWDLNAGHRVFGSAVLTVSGRALSATGEARAVQFTPDGSRLIALTAAGLRAWNPNTGEDVTPAGWVRAETDETGTALAVSPDGTRVAVAGRVNNEQGVVTADLAGTRFVPTPAAVAALDFSPDGTRLVATFRRSPNRTAPTGQVWRVDLSAGFALEPEYKLTDLLAGLRFSREGKALYGVRAGREVVLLDAATGVERGVLEGHADRIVGAGLTPRDLVLVTVGRDGSVKRWNAEPPPRGGLRGDAAPFPSTPSPPFAPPRPLR